LTCRSGRADRSSFNTTVLGWKRRHDPDRGRTLQVVRIRNNGTDPGAPSPEPCSSPARSTPKPSRSR
jgi:hypothetical protein